MTDRERGNLRFETQETGTGERELYLTIENALEDRVQAYTRRLRMKRLLAAAQRSTSDK